jgi:hypothetical protein
MKPQKREMMYCLSADCKSPLGSIKYSKKTKRGKVDYYECKVCDARFRAVSGQLQFIGVRSELKASLYNAEIVKGARVYMDGKFVGIGVGK